MKMLMWSFSSFAERPIASAGSTEPLVQTSKRQLVIVGDLTKTGCVDGVVHLADRRVDGVDRDESKPQIVSKFLSAEI